MRDLLAYVLLVISFTGGSLRLLATYASLSPRLACDCKALTFRHEKGWIIFATGASSTMLGVLAAWGHAAPSGYTVAAALNVLIGAWWLHDWWRHNRDQRKRLKDRVLGVVRATAAGLKIVPVPAGAQA